MPPARRTRATELVGLNSILCLKRTSRKQEVPEVAPYLTVLHDQEILSSPKPEIWGEVSGDTEADSSEFCRKLNHSPRVFCAVSTAKHTDITCCNTIAMPR